MSAETVRAVRIDQANRREAAWEKICRGARNRIAKSVAALGKKFKVARQDVDVSCFGAVGV